MVGVVGGGITGLKVTLQVERDQINKFGSINMIERKNCSTLVRPKLNTKINLHAIPTKSLSKSNTFNSTLVGFIFCRE